MQSHGGLLIYLHKHYKYKHLVGETSNIWEGQFIRVTDEETNTHVTIGNTDHREMSMKIINSSLKNSQDN